MHNPKSCLTQFLEQRSYAFNNQLFIVHLLYSCSFGLPNEQCCFKVFYFDQLLLCQKNLYLIIKITLSERLNHFGNDFVLVVYFKQSLQRQILIIFLISEYSLTWIFKHPQHLRIKLKLIFRIQLTLLISEGVITDTFYQICNKLFR